MEEEENDSLDLLLDTLCNAFGGIILITLLIALMSQEANEFEAIPQDFRTEWMLENQSVRNLEDEIEVEGSILDSIRDTVVLLENAQGRENFIRLKELSVEKKNLVQNLKSLEARFDLLPKNSSTMANEIQFRLNKLREVMSNNLVRSDSVKSKLLKNSASVIETRRKTEAAKRERTQVLRMPTEKGESGKSYIWVVVKYGKVYPCYHPDREVIFNLTEVTGVKGNRIVFHEPKANRGFSPEYDRYELVDYFRSVNSSESYLAFMVYPNDSSFRSFNQAKVLCTSTGLGYTWEPYDQESLGLTSDGKGARNEL
jgi:hypothetical protein